MKWDSIKYFIAVSQYKNFSKAASALFITQSALSKQIASLENEIGIKLFERDNKKVELTPAGSYLYKESLQIDYHIRQTLNQMRFIRDYEQKQLTINCHWDCTPQLSRIIAAFLLKRPAAQITLTNELYHYPDVKDYSSPPDFTMRCYDCEEEEYGTVLVAGKEKVLLNVSHPMSNRSSISIDDLTGMSLILLNQYPPHTRWKEYLKRNRPDIGIIETNVSNDLFSYLIFRPLDTALIWGPSQTYNDFSRFIPLNEGHNQEVRLVPSTQQGNLSAEFINTAKEVFQKF